MSPHESLPLALATSFSLGYGIGVYLQAKDRALNYIEKVGLAKLRSVYPHKLIPPTEVSMTNPGPSLLVDSTQVVSLW